MPLIPLVPVIAGGLGFGAGFLTSEATGKAIKLAVVVGAGYLIYKYVSK